MKKTILFALAMSFLQACKTDFASLQYTSGDADFTQTVAIGGNFLSGYQDGALTADGQQKSVAALLTEQFKFSNGGTFNQALLPAGDGIGLTNKAWQSPYRQAETLGNFTDCKGETSLFPIEHPMRISEASLFLMPTGGACSDFAIPFARLDDLADISFGTAAKSPYFHRFASAPGASSAIDDALHQNPSFFILWTGMEDIYNFALSGGTAGAITDAAVFSQTLEALLQKLEKTGAKGVIANIPDLDAFPYFSLVSPRALNLTVNQADSLNALTGSIFEFKEGENGFIVKDIASPFGYRQMTTYDRVLFSVPIDSIKCHFLGVIPADMPNQYVLDSLECAAVRSNIQAYNTAIASLASKYELAFVDMNRYFQDLQKGIANDGVHYSPEFIKGGFFSLDGYHPNQKGYGLISNEFVRSINQRYHANVPETLCKDCKGIRFP